jgi:hypothetical protein
MDRLTSRDGVGNAVPRLGVMRVVLCESVELEGEGIAGRR